MEDQLLKASNGLRNLVFVLAVALATLSQVPSPAEAALASTVMSMIANAERAFAEGKYDRASELYEQAHKAAPVETTLLYNAARSAQLAKLFERAQALFVQYIALPDKDAKYAEKAVSYLRDVRGELDKLRVDEAKAKARDAEALQKERRYREAAAAYKDAFRLVPTNFDYLFRAGNAAALGCDEQMGKLYLQDYLKRAPADAPDRAEAQARLAGMASTCKDGPARGASEPVAKVAPERAVPPTASPPQSSNGLAWAVVGTGAIAVLAGGGLYASTLSAADEYAALVAGKDSNGVIASVSYEAARNKWSEFHGKQVAGVALVGAGVAIAGVGTWLLMRGPSKVAVRPAPAGVGLQITWNWGGQ